MSVWTKIFGHRNYRQFVVICHPRTGSNLLSDYLKAHSNIKMHGEIFAKLNGRSIDEVYRTFRRLKPRRIKASGFKLFYAHPEDGNPEDIHRLIERMPQPLIIHLVRKDKFRTLVSWKIALSTNVWGLREGQPLVHGEKKKVMITPEEALKFLSDITKLELIIENRFKQHHYLRIIYEDLVSNPQACLNSIFVSLGLSDQPVFTTYKRSNPEPLHELISNYQELADKGILEKFRVYDSGII